MSGQGSSEASSDWLGLSGRVCVVTGGGGGIGRATAISLAKAGANVAAIDRDEAGLAITEAELHRHGGRHLVTRCDTTSAESVTAASQTIEKALGPCNVLVNTAAILRPGALDSLPLAEWNAVLAVNLTGYFLCAQILHLRCVRSTAAASCMCRRLPAATRKAEAAPTASAKPA